MNILRLRLQKLFDNIEAINYESPGIVLAELTQTEIPRKVHKITEKELNIQIKNNIDTICKLSNSSYDKVVNSLIKKYAKSSIEKSLFISTTSYGKIIGIDAKPYFFDYLIDLGFLNKIDNKYELTSKGEFFGSYHCNDKNEQWVVWNKELLDPIINPFKEKLICHIDLRLFHMTHISNLNKILDQGLFAHSKITNYVDISNYDVNLRRVRKEKYHNFKLHDYVPLYFNARNAMLYQKQIECPHQIVILEIDKKVINQDYTKFSKGNAARDDSKIETSKYKLINFPWSDIYSKTWSEDNHINITKKSLMMSECLIYNHITAENIRRIHCENIETYSKLKSTLTGIKQEIVISPDLFF
ncbi:DUF4433 domain-containing protein [Psychrobacter sp. Ps2]|uniref:DUF4433 domain-containing protein n=1 Tax=Psychrobacter sp. Ps2 TaxID=2790956 RepID=UPI001EE12E44|nr:DUF4433 domain-containing protein [Psychrobacter sp. Ps2]MCG3858081.1 DUF4433 domain-containing protein [Psychrobacter sp. Ps2]